MLETVTEIGKSTFAFLLMISVIVTIHEWGHYRSARLFGLIGTTFSIGFGPKLFGRKDRHGTEWRVSPILLGGYVRFPGDGDEAVAPGTKTLNSLPRWQRAVVVAAGPVINLILAVLLLAYIAYDYGYPTGQPIVEKVEVNSPAAEAGFRPGDAIIKVNGNPIVDSMEASQMIMLHPNEALTFTIRRDDANLDLIALPSPHDYSDELGGHSVIGYLGITMPRAFERAETIGQALTKGVSDGLFTTYAQVKALSQIATGARSVTELSGPVRIAKLSSNSLEMGIIPFLYVMAMISIAVGIMNFLPVPGLDGGHLLTYAIEGALRRDIPEAVMKPLLRVGFACLILIGVFAIGLDMAALT